MFARTMMGMRLSLVIGLVTAGLSSLIAVVLGAIAALGGSVADHIVSWLIDLFIGMPHLVFMILIAFVAGGGVKGVILGVGLTHWPSLARLIRAEIMKLATEPYVEVSRRTGFGRLRVFWSHILPQVESLIVV
ncbi:hypothetical protein BSZ39_12660 [Bowdeniella nasicola]|uniref:ABC transmembrane type-1 domain-containing protein n=2 Tax=Bowdeniella nasicola TaxID=208480 RepID=A0A1Q5PWY1_9ACTO|nr:hypothetical protein BSZ39_12660 [Bowdeniella nasicola]